LAFILLSNFVDVLRLKAKGAKSQTPTVNTPLSLDPDLRMSGNAYVTCVSVSKTGSGFGMKIGSAPSGTGVFVIEVASGGAADKAGICSGAVILSIDGEFLMNASYDNILPILVQRSTISLCVAQQKRKSQKAMTVDLNTNIVSKHITLNAGASGFGIKIGVCLPYISSF
jgi:predicted metalloprotease with PDZ domain